ncbi:DEAD/DEAH box helicase [Pseudoalteromonas luteoviolacea]|uniref:DEAD/DEAH box helicase n=1 Tax=Pseudoalteromonas luteoviolacea TaxID=43657 RepID=UPI001F431C0F|nr:DEAD/DEAH box helicase [Pseudoalteromonas luteoviolacea]MCF6441220.1 DEAD/DEAH box helicase [Pseudoalteromonas luteoviolacea]
MSSQLSKEQLLALFEEIKQEQSSQFPLSDRFLKQYFNSAMLAKAKEYLNDDQISFLEHSEDFSKIDAQVLGNFGNTFTQHIKIELVKGAPSVEAQCSCSNNPKCRHIAAVLLKLKVDHSGGFGESFLVNDWFNELSSLQQSSDLNASNVLLFVLEHRGNEVLLNPKMSPHKPDGHYPLGRVLTEKQLNAHVPPKDILESDYRLFSWVRSQNTPGHFELSGKWGFAALQQLTATKRCFFGNSRKPLQFGHMQHLDFSWQNENDSFKLVSHLSDVEQWLLIKSDPPVYLDTENMLLGRIESELSAQEIAHLHTMPSIQKDKIEAVIKRFQDIFADNVIPPPQGYEQLIDKDKLVAKLSVNDGEYTHLQLTLFNSAQKYSTEKQLNRCEKMLLGLGFEAQSDGFKLPVEDEVSHHWYNCEVRPYLQRKMWQVEEIHQTKKVLVPKVTLQLKRDKKHHVIGKVMFDDRQILLDWDKAPCHEVNSIANVFQYVQIAQQYYALSKDVYEELLLLKSRFSYYLSSSQFKFPLSYAKRLFELDAVESVSDDVRLLDYLDELNKPINANESLLGDSQERFTLRDYQLQGVSWLKFLNRHQLGGILADDMGLGKTLQVIAYFISQHNTLVTKPSLIVCPTSLVGNWQNEFKKFASHLPVLTVHGSNRDKQLNQVAKARFIITTYPLLKRDLAHYSELQFDSIVLDEAQYIKNETAQISKCVKQLSAEFKLCMSGTPVENNLMELKSLLDFVMPDVLGTKQQFKQNFQLPIEKDRDSKRAKELQSLIAPFILRRTKSEVVRELPAKTELIKKLEFMPEQASLYQHVQGQIESSLIDLFKEQGVESSKLAFLDALLKLRQICCHPELVDKAGAHQQSAKFKWLKEHLPILLKEGRKIIIFSQFTTVLDMISSLCNEIETPFTMLTGQTRQRDKAISRFTEGEVDVFLISLKAGGTGLNLTQADTVIHFDPWWNPAVENQATDRAYRIGQDKPVFVYKLIVANSIEQKVYQMQKDKQALVDALFADTGVNLNEFNEAQMLELIKN